MAGLLGTVVQNPILASAVAVGGIAGGVSGAFLGATTLTAVAFSGGLAAVGLIGGALAGHYINREIDNNTPTPMGMRPVSQPKMEASKTVEVGFKPSVILAESSFAEFKKEAKSDPTYQQIADKMPMFSQVMAYGRMNLNGTVSEDGKSLVIQSAKFSAPFQQDTHVAIADVSIPLKDGKIDQKDPAAKEAMQQIMYQTIEQRLPPKLQEKAKASVDKLLSKADAEPETPSDGKAKDKLLKGAKLALTMIQPDALEDKYVGPSSSIPKKAEEAGRTPQ